MRRVLYQENAREAGLLGPIDRHSAVGAPDYHALKLTAPPARYWPDTERKLHTGLLRQDPRLLSPQFSSGYLKPEDPGFDRGNCEQSRTHIANLTLGVQTPDFDAPALRAFASNWRVSGIINARSGSWLSVTTTRTSPARESAGSASTWFPTTCMVRSR